MAFNIQTLGQTLQQTLDPNAAIRKAAERDLESLEGKPQYGIILLSLVGDQSIPEVIRVAGSVYFKNFVRRHWAVVDVGTSKISEEDREKIRSLVVGLMLNSPPLVQRQLSDAISVIGKEDFPDKWPSLLNDMVKQMTSASQSGQYHIIDGVLQTGHSLFKKYRHEFKSQALWTEIKFVLDNFAKPFTDLFLQTIEFSVRPDLQDVNIQKTLFGSLVLCAKIFYSLNVQELAEFFEDHINIWMQKFLDLMSVQKAVLQTDDDEPGLLEQLKTQICENVSLYASKYEEEFQPFMGSFVQAIYELLRTTGQQTKYDLLVSAAMKFVTTAADRGNNKALFELPGVLDTLCTAIIVPNMQFRDSDEEMFEDNPEEFIRRDIEGSDVDTRRRAACDLVRSLARYFEPQITSVFGQYIQRMLADYTTNPKKTWKSKDAAIYLVTSMAVKGATARAGTTITSDLVNVVEFYTAHIKPEIERPNINELPVLKAASLKYIVTFRNQLPVDGYLIPVLPCVIAHLASDSIVVHTYAANFIEKLFTMRNSSSLPVVSLAQLKTLQIETPLLQGLFSVFSKPGSGENEYVMKAIMRTIFLYQERILDFIDIITFMSSKLSEVSKNPSKPHFNHYLFESITLCVKIGCEKDKAYLANFENLLFPIIQNILTNDIMEFMPYAFQILSLLLEYHPKGQVPPTYIELFNLFLTPELWERSANAPPMVRYITAFIARSSHEIAARGKIEPLLGVFQKLIASRANDHLGFSILQALILHAESDLLAGYVDKIFFVLFARLTSSKTTKFVKNILVFMSLFAYKYKPDSLIKVIDTLQPNMFEMVVQRLIAPELSKVTGQMERKICAVGMTSILLDSEQVISGPYQRLWPLILQALMTLFALPEEEPVEDDNFAEVEETGYQSAYVQLTFGSKKAEDPFEGVISDPRAYLVTGLQGLSQKHPGILGPMIQTLSPEQHDLLKKYFDLSNVTLV